MADDATDAQNGRATIREVHSLLGEVRAEIGGKIDAYAASVNQAIAGHADRLVRVELGQQHLEERVTKVEVKQELHGREIGHLQDQQRTDEAATDALTKDKSRRRTWRRDAVVAATAMATAGGSVALVFVTVVH